MEDCLVLTQIVGTVLDPIDLKKGTERHLAIHDHPVLQAVPEKPNHSPLDLDIFCH